MWFYAPGVLLLTFVTNLLRFTNPPRATGSPFKPSPRRSGAGERNGCPFFPITGYLGRGYRISWFFENRLFVLPKTSLFFLFLIFNPIWGTDPNWPLLLRLGWNHQLHQLCRNIWYFALNSIVDFVEWHHFFFERITFQTYSNYNDSSGSGV